MKVDFLFFWPTFCVLSNMKVHIFGLTILYAFMNMKGVF